MNSRTTQLTALAIVTLSIFLATNDAFAAGRPAPQSNRGIAASPQKNTGATSSNTLKKYSDTAGPEILANVK